MERTFRRPRVSRGKGRRTWGSQRPFPRPVATPFPQRFPPTLTSQHPAEVSRIGRGLRIFFFAQGRISSGGESPPSGPFTALGREAVSGPNFSTGRRSAPLSSRRRPAPAANTLCRTTQTAKTSLKALFLVCSACSVVDLLGRTSGKPPRMARSRRSANRSPGAPILPEGVA